MAPHLVKHHRFYWDDADHLIELARDYEKQADEDDSERDDLYYLYWKYRLARMSFIARMMSIEALLNNVLEQFSIPTRFKELGTLAKQFPNKEKFPNNRRKRRGRTFQVPMKWKLYLTPYLCNEDSRMEKDEYFDFETGPYRKFRQLIVIRNEFVHTRFDDQDISIHIEPKFPLSKNSRRGEFEQEPDFSDCCREMGIDKDPVCFKIDNARVCGAAMREIVLELNRFLDGRILNEDFWESDHIDRI